MRRRSSGDLNLHHIEPGVYLYRGFFSNSAVFVQRGGTLVVDTQVSPLAARRLRSEIAKVTHTPVTHAVNTHHHGDHTGGNEVFAGAEIVAGELTAQFIRERDGERFEYARTFGLEFQEAHPIRPPTRTFTGRYEIGRGEERIELLHLGRAETPDATVAWWPSRGVVASGDGVATWDYPFFGVPFLDEGLRDDGEWLKYLDALRRMRPRVLLPGHGPALVGELVIRRRLDLLTALITDLLEAVKAELAAGTPIPELVERVDHKLARYTRRPDLREHTVSQRFAIYRCVNSLLPERRGRGWWHDLRPSVIRRAPPAVSLLERWTQQHPADAQALALLSDLYFAGSRRVRPLVDATEYIAASIRAAKAALRIDPAAKLALLSLGCAEVFGGMVLAQPMQRAIAKLEEALAQGGLTAEQRRRARFFLGKAHQMERRDGEADRHYRELLPVWARPAYPLVRERIWAFP
jgi:glyoxylase-like metal-dependent hydrolase (beta-lactamase superfamily II)